MRNMRAMVINTFGSPEVLQPADVPAPTPAAHDLLIEVHAAALNPIDFKIRQGAFAKGRAFPIVLGFDVSGVVRGMGEKVTGFHDGDEVYASPSLVRDGANAQYVCVDARTAAAKPKSLDHVHAAGLPLVTLTAWEALYDRVDVRRGDDVLIHAGGGGVGHVAIQLAKRRGCRVLTTASRDESIELCRSFGADVVINHKTEDFVERVAEETAGRGCRVVFDCVGGAVFDRSPPCVAVNGHLITIAGAGDGVRDAFSALFVRNVTLHFEMMGAPTMHDVEPEKQGRILRAAAELVDKDELRVHISRTFDLTELAEAHRLQETGRVTGKLALRVK